MARFHLVLSPDVWRGFSGEGQVLSRLADKSWERSLPKVQKALAWQAMIDEEGLSRQTRLAPPQIRSALAALAARGLVGYDLASGAYFHRELPFDLALVDKLQPRLVAAKKLLAAGGVKPVVRTLTRRASEGVPAEPSGIPRRRQRRRASRAHLGRRAAAAPAPGIRSIKASAARASMCWPRRCSPSRTHPRLSARPPMPDPTPAEKLQAILDKGDKKPA